MSPRTHAVVLSSFLIVAAPVVTHADTFASLLQRAKDEAAAGHRWAPPQDNLVDTLSQLLKQIAQATPEQLAEIKTLEQVIRDAPAQVELPPPATPTTTTTAPRPPTPTATPTPTTATPTSGAETIGFSEMMYQRGLASEQHKDISAARRLYEAAARNDYAPACLALGRLYDPTYLRRLGVIGGVSGDLTLARVWYGRALALGDSQAAPFLSALP